MQNAATIAGLGFGNSNTSLCHALAHSIGATSEYPTGGGRHRSSLFPGIYLFQSSLENVPDPVKRLESAARFAGIEAQSGQEAPKN